MEIICYACGRGENPENTLEAIAHCQKTNPDWRVDIDLQLTKDNEIVLFHDDNAYRRTGVNVDLSDIILKELKKLNAGYYFKKDNQYPFRKKPIKIPTLKEVLNLYPSARFVLDIHTNSLKAIDLVIEIIEKNQATKKVIIVSQYDEVIKKIKEKRPQWIYGAATKEVKKMVFSSFLFLDFLFPLYSDILFIPQKFKGITLLTTRVIKHVKKREKKIVVWLQEGKTNDDVVCIETVKEYFDLKNKGIDAVYTEYPEKLYQLIKDL